MFIIEIFLPGSIPVPMLTSRDQYQAFHIVGIFPILFIDGANSIVDFSIIVHLLENICNLSAYGDRISEKNDKSNQFKAN